MNIHTCGPQFDACGQIRLADIDAIAGKGYRLIICNRPDGEEPGQPAFAEIAAAARAHGIDARYLPIAGPGDIARQAPALSEIIRTEPGPVLAWCRSGARSTALYAAATA